MLCLILVDTFLHSYYQLSQVINKKTSTHFQKYNLQKYGRFSQIRKGN